MTKLSRRLFGAFAACGLALLAACNVDLENLDAPGLAKDKDIAAREVYKLFRNGDMAALRPRFGPEMQGPEAEAAIPQIIALIPKAEPTKSRLVSWKSNTSFGSPSVESLVTNHEYTYPDTIVDAETVMTREGGSRGPWQIRGFHVKRRPVGSSPPAAATTTPPANPAADTSEFVTPEQAAAEEEAARGQSSGDNGQGGVSGGHSTRQ